MKTLRFFAVGIAFCFSGFVVQRAPAATIPAGTHVVVRTLATITSIDARGTRVPAQLVRPLFSQGRAVIPAGARVMGHVVSSRRLYSKQERLTVDISAIQFKGRNHAVRTTGPYLVDNRNWVTHTGGTVSRGGYAVRAGRILHFRLAQPLAF